MPDGIDDTCIHYTSLQLMQGLTAVDLLQKQLGGKTTECLGGSLAQLKFTKIQTSLSRPQNCDWHWIAVQWPSATDRSVKWKRVARKAVFTSVLRS